MTTYESLKKTAQDAPISQLALEDLKSMYESKIASKRRYDCIRTIKDFIDVLERRDVLSETNIEFLQKLMSFCQSTSLRDALCYYRAPNSESIYPQRFMNEYRHHRLAESFQENLCMTRNFTSGIGHTDHFYGSSIGGPVTLSFVGILPDGKRKAIYKKLCQDLGRDWRSFARELDFREGDIDNIESQSNDLQTRTAKVLTVFEEDECNDPKQHCLLLCHALERCHRKDLRRAIEKIMSY